MISPPARCPCATAMYSRLPPKMAGALHEIGTGRDVMGSLSFNPGGGVNGFLAARTGAACGRRRRLLYPYAVNDDRRDPSGLLLACLGDAAPVGAAQQLVEQVGVATAAHRLWAPVADSDLILVNLESPLARNSGTVGLFSRKTFTGLANNHIMDAGDHGLLETMDLLSAHGVPHAGAGRNLESARQPAVIEADGLRLGILSAADPRFHAAGRTTAGVFPAQSELLRESIAETTRRCDHVIVSLHVGIEFLPYPSPAQLCLADTCLAAGASLVLFHHAHCIAGHRQDARGVVLFGTGKYLFPYDFYVGHHGLTRWAIRRARRAAAWQVRLAKARDVHVQRVIPLWIGANGFPEKPADPDAEWTLRWIRRLSRRSAAALPFWRTLALLNPVFAGLNARAYLELARQAGFRKMLMMAFCGLRAQLGRHDGLARP